MNFSGKDVTCDNIYIYIKKKKQGFTLFLKNTFLEKLKEESN